MDADSYSAPQTSWCTWRRARFFALLSAFFAITFIAIAAFVPPVIRSTIDSGIRDSVVLTAASQHDNSYVWRTFRSYKDKDAVPVSYSVYIWNITNPLELIHGEKPIMRQVGPYVFTEVKERLNATFEIDIQGHHVVKYWEWTYYILDTDKTSPALQSMDQMITNINFLFFAYASQAPMLAGPILGPYGILDLARNYTGQKNAVEGDAIEMSCAFQTRTAAEWMFGYVDDKLIAKDPTGYQFPGLVGNVSSIDVTTMQNAQYMEMYTGEDLDALSRQYKVYNGMSSMIVPAAGSNTPTIPMFKTDLANRIYGTDGTQFRRNPPKGGSLPCFVSELNRVVPLVNANDLMVTDKGIHLQRYVIDSRFLMNDTLVPENNVYYNNWANGVLNVSAANNYVPVYMSRPHCLGVDQRICDKVDGFHPDPALHETYVDVEPMTGMTLHAQKRLQANFRWPKVTVTDFLSSATWFNAVDSELLTPLFWVEESGEIPDNQAKGFLNSIYLFNDIATYGGWAFYCVGNLFIVLALFLFNLSLKRTATQKNLQHSEPFNAPSNYHAL